MFDWLKRWFEPKEMPARISSYGTLHAQCAFLKERAEDIIRVSDMGMAKHLTKEQGVFLNDMRDACEESWRRINLTLEAHRSWAMYFEKRASDPFYRFSGQDALQQYKQALSELDELIPLIPPPLFQLMMPNVSYLENTREIAVVLVEKMELASEPAAILDATFEKLRGKK